MHRFFREWGQLLMTPLPWVGCLGAMLKFLGPAAFAAASAAVAAYLGNVPGWTLPVLAFAAFYISLTAGMAWERALTPVVEIGPLSLDRRPEFGAQVWGPAIGIFYVQVRNGPVEAAITIRIVSVESFGVKRIERSLEGHWRGYRPDFNGILGPHQESQY